VLEGMAEYYSRNLAREVQKGMRENAHQARHNGGKPALGYNTTPEGKYIVNEAEAAIVRHIFRRRAEHASYNTIIAELNQKGWTTKRGQPFGKNSLWEILQNKKYIGVYQYGRSLNSTPTKRRNSHQAPDENTITIVDAVPAIVDNTTWAEVQTMLKKRTGPSKAKREYLLSGIIYCHCGALMQGTSTSARGKRYHYYKCGAWDRLTGEKGEHQRIPLEEAEAKVLEDIQARILAPERRQDILKSIVSAQPSLATTQTDELKSMESIVKEAEIKINRGMDAIADGNIDSKRAAKKIEELQDRQDAAKERIKEIGGIIGKVYLTEAQVNAVLDRLLEQGKEKEPAAIRLLIEKMVESITVSPTEFRVRIVLARFGAGEPNRSSRQIIYESIRARRGMETVAETWS